MFTTFAALTAHETRQITEVGALLGLLGGVAVGLAAIHGFRRWGLLAAGVLLVVGFALIIYGLHYGLDPYRVVVVR